MHDVAIIIPSYCPDLNHIEWLEQAVKSAMAQDCEVVVYDDASPIQPDFLRDLDITYIQGAKNGGVAYARNMAVGYARSKLILPLDGDDLLKPGAVSTLLRYWDGYTPVYPDVAKFGIETNPHYTLLDFNCEHIVNHVGFASVNVLHPRAYWDELGGWDTDLAFYEDGWYNARLFAKWCGKRCPEPLIDYRMHPGQRTKTFAPKSADFARLVMSKIRSLDMPCSACSKSRTVRSSGSSIPSQPMQSVDPSTLPGELEGRILAQYIGGQGKAKHYYQGVATKFMYKVMYGDYIYVDPADAGTQGDSRGSLLIRVQPQAAPAPIQAAPAPAQTAPVVPAKVVERKPVASMERKPI